MSVIDRLLRFFIASDARPTGYSSPDNGDTVPSSLLAQNSIIPRPNTWMRPDVSFQELTAAFLHLPRLRSSIGRHIAATVGNNHYFTASPIDEKYAAPAEKVRKHLERLSYAMNLPMINTQIAADAWLSGNCIMTRPQYLRDTVIPPRVLPLSSFIDFYLDDNMDITRYRRSAISLGRHAIHDIAARMQMANSSSGVKNISEITSDNVLHFSRGHENGLPWGSGMGQIILRTGIGYTLPDGTKSIAASSAQQWEMMTDVLTKYLVAGMPRHLLSYKDRMVDDEEVKKLANWSANSKPLTHFATKGDVDVKTIALQMEQKYDAIIDHINNTATSTTQDPIENMWTNSGLFSHASSRTLVETMLPHIIGYEYDHKRFIEINLLKPIVDIYTNDPEAWDNYGIEMNWGTQTKTSISDITEFVTSWRQSPPLQDVVPAEYIIKMYQEAGVNIGMLSADEIEKNRQERMERAQQIMQQTNNKKEKKEDDDDDMDDVESNDDDDDEPAAAEASRQQSRYYKLAADRLESGAQ